MNTPMPPHRTAGERRAQASAAAAVARAQAHIRPPAETDEQLGHRYPYVTPARARQIRHELEHTYHQHSGGDHGQH